MSQLIGARPRPRVLVRWRGDNADELVAAVRLFAPTVEKVEYLANTRLSEWDVLVTDSDWNCDPGIHANKVALPEEISVLCTFCGRAWWEGPVEGGGIGTFNIYDSHLCNEFRPPNASLERSLQLLVREQLLPVVQTRRSHPYIALHKAAVGQEPFLVAATGAVLAGRYRRGVADVAGEVWLLPADVPDLVPWIRLAFERWHALFPDRFPTDIGWRSRPEWWTSQEAATESDLAGLALEQAAAEAEFEQRRLELRTARRCAAATADAGERRLLVSQGDELVAAVTAALRSFGFQVDDERDLDATRSDLLEDLYVTDPADPEWDALVEVRGYAGGAKGNDLQRIGRFVERFIVKHGRPPAARWYVVSQNVGDDPSRRRPPLAGSEDVPIFAEGGGVIIETKDLYTLLRRVATGAVSVDRVRAALRCATGIFEADPVA